MINYLHGPTDLRKSGNFASNLSADLINILVNQVSSTQVAETSSSCYDEITFHLSSQQVGN